MSVFATDGDQRATLALVRALGRAQVPVTVGSTRRESLAGSSKFCRARVDYPSPAEKDAAFQEKLVSEMRRSHYQVLIPMTDITTILIARIRDRLEPFVRLPISSAEQIDRIRDKQRVLLEADKIGIPAPQTFTADDEAELDEIASRVRYPVVLKPRLSWTERSGQWLSTKVEYAYSTEELKRKYAQAHVLVANPLIQERIPGEGRGVFLLVWNGELKAALCHRRLREKPPWGGVSVFRESIPLDREMVDKSFRLLQAFDWQGPAMVEYKADDRDGTLKLMDVNGRFWGSLQLALDAGMNFPLLYYRLALGENPHSQFQYQAGVRSRWLLGDLDQLLIRWKHGPVRNGLSGHEPSRFRASVDFLRFCEPNLHYEILRIDDPAPGWHECKAYVRALLDRSGTSKETASAH
jgi:predicted ATP-grasp superfamily ATP-dependent carboligase